MKSPGAPFTTTEPSPCSSVTRTQNACHSVSSVSALSSPQKTVSLESSLKEENIFLYRSLYAIPETAKENHSTITKLKEDLQKEMAKDRKLFDQTLAASVAEKGRHLRLFSARLLSSENASVAKVFLLFSMAMFTAPVLVLLITLKICEHCAYQNSTLLGGLSSVVTAVVLMAAYVVYAFYEDQTPLQNHKDNPSVESISGEVEKKRSGKKKTE